MIPRIRYCDRCGKAQSDIISVEICKGANIDSFIFLCTDCLKLVKEILRPLAEEKEEGK